MTQITGDRTVGAVAVPNVRRRSIDLGIILLLTITIAVLATRNARLIPAGLLFHPDANNTLFEADTARVVETFVTYPGAFGVRYFLHPLVSEWVYPIIASLDLVPGIDMAAALRVLTAAAAGAWIAGIYLALRLIRCRRVDAALFALLAGTSAAAIVWFSVPETHAWGSLSIVAALLLAAVCERRAVAGRWHVLVQVATISFTITNWLAGLAASFMHLRWRRFMLMSLTAAMFAGGLSLLEPVMRKVSQRTFVLSPHTTVLLTALAGVLIGLLLWRLSKSPRAPRVAERIEAMLSRRWTVLLLALGAILAIAAATRIEGDFIATPYRGSMVQSATSFLFHAMVLPEYTESDRYGKGWGTLSVQTALPGESSPWGVAAAGLWAILLVAGILAIIRMERLRRFRGIVAIALLGQFVLHLIYGDETFLYALNWLPLLVVMAALATHTRLRPAVRAVAAILIVLAAINNIRQFDLAAERITEIAAASAPVGP